MSKSIFMVCPLIFVYTYFHLSPSLITFLNRTKFILVLSFIFLLISAVSAFLTNIATHKTSLVLEKCFFLILAPAAITWRWFCLTFCKFLWFNSLNTKNILSPNLRVVSFHVYQSLVLLSYILQCYFWILLHYVQYSGSDIFILNRCLLLHEKFSVDILSNLNNSHCEFTFSAYVTKSSFSCFPMFKHLYRI